MPPTSARPNPTPVQSLLIANRGEIALRIARSAAELGIETVAIRASDDLHGAPALADRVLELGASGPAAYLDLERILQLAEEAGCDALHPGYGFLSETPRLARGCAQRSIRFIGPTAEVLEQFSHKPAARRHARALGVPVLPATDEGCSLAEATEFVRTCNAPVLIKAVHGGGGRGMRIVDPAAADDQQLAHLWRRCSAEAKKAFGDGALYLERMIQHARHVEVQIAGDGAHVIPLGDRDCTLQRRHQKIVEIAPSPDLPEALRERLCDDAVRMASSVGYTSLGTFEFLIDVGARHEGNEQVSGYAFIEANPRLQVEHTVTEEVYGIDLVQLQLAIAEGRSLADVELLGSTPRSTGTAIQCRINAETFDERGSLRPGGGPLLTFSPPCGPGVRTDSYLHPGDEPNLTYDPLLAKLVVHSRAGNWQGALRKCELALAEFQISGCTSNLPFLRYLVAGLARDPQRFATEVTTRWIDESQAALWGQEYGADATPGNVAASVRSTPAGSETPPPAGHSVRGAGAQLRSDDPLAVLHHGRQTAASAGTGEPSGEEVPRDGSVLVAPMQGTVVSLEAQEGETVAAGQILVILEAMKMEHEIRATAAGVVRELLVSAGDAVYAGHALVRLQPSGDLAANSARQRGAQDPQGAIAQGATKDLDAVRADLQELFDRKAKLRDQHRPRAVARRRKTGQRTVRENVEDLVDAGSWIEYGGLVLAAQRRRRELQDLIDNTPADGLVAGLGTVNGDLFPAERARCAVASYDYTVLAGTQGKQNHEKKDRLFDIARKWRLPLVFFTEGGGGRPGDTDVLGVAGLDCWAFQRFAELSGLVPLVGINSGRCFAGNAALLGCCDVVIATANSTIGMGGPAMIEGGGLGIFTPEEVGPMQVQVPNGVVDIAVADEAEAVATAKQYLSYFQGALKEYDCADQRHLRHAIPENRLRVYEVRRIIELLADRGSVLELRRDFGVGMITCLARVEGKAVGIVANNPQHLAGAIDSPGADKAARFLQLCDAFDIPILTLCDTPGIMVGPETEKTAIVRHCSRLFVVGASLTVPLMTIVLRKGYGLGAQAMAGGSFKGPLFTVAWPTGEFGGMGLEGAVKLGYRKELAAIEDAAERKSTFERMVAESYERGKAINTASHFELDDVIDPAESRHWISRALASVPPPAARVGKKRPCVDTW